jgi:hypothetical protein
MTPRPPQQRASRKTRWLTRADDLAMVLVPIARKRQLTVNAGIGVKAAALQMS